jgi:hypothetical protein
VLVIDEQRDMWKVYMAEKRYADALEACPDSLRKNVFRAQGKTYRRI